MADIPDYDQYSLLSLYQALNTIAADRYPETFATLERELQSRESTSKFELEECYYRLDKNRWPQYAQQLLGQIEKLGGFTVLTPEIITDLSKYWTFWRRFGALLVDSLVFVLPAGALLFIVYKSPLGNAPLLSIYLQEALQYLMLAYSITMHARFGQTLGKMAAGVKVMDVDEVRHIGITKALLRDAVPLVLTVVSTVFFLLFGTSYKTDGLTGSSALVANLISFVVSGWGIAELLTMLFNRKRRAVHDLIAGTVVVRVP